MCDPEWKIKTSVEILVFIHRPHEDFSDLLGRWRQSQVYLDKEYEWIMHPRHSHILSEGTNTIYPLFVVFNQTSERIQRGLVGADLPFVKQTPITLEDQEYQVSRLVLKIVVMARQKALMQEARVKRVWAILHFFTQFDFIVFTYLSYQENVENP